MVVRLPVSEQDSDEILRFPLRNPVLPVSQGGLSGEGAVLRLSADGSTLLFSSFVNQLPSAPPAIALAPDASIYAGSGAGILRIPIKQPGGLSVDGVFNAFSGSLVYATPGMLLAIRGQNLAPDFIDVGLNDPNPLPTELGGVQVLFDGIPAEMFQVASDHLICVVPTAVQGKSSVTVQVVTASDTSVPFILPVWDYGTPGLLTQSFPNLPPTGPIDGNIRNADDTLNDADHPAAPGSTVTLFVTGLTGPGPVSLYWNAPTWPQIQGVATTTGTARPMKPGFIHAMYAIDFRIPDAPGRGVYLVPVPGVLTRAVIGTQLSERVGVYVK